MSLPELYLRKREERRIRAGHLWVYANEVDTKRTPLKSFEPGTLVALRGSNGKGLGIAYTNPGSLICARLLDRDPERVIDERFFRERIRAAQQLREALFDVPWYRLVFGESDLLPGLVVDRYGEHLVVQLNTAGMEAQRDVLCAALAAEIQPASILLRCDGRARRQEQLEPHVTQWTGTTPEHLRLLEGSLDLQVPVHSGQKTGWFYDQRANRALLAGLAEGKRVLDVCCYLGGFGLSAAQAGASEVLCVDDSASALAQLNDNAAAMGLAERVRTLQGDAFACLGELAEAGEQFDLVVLDPPAFVQRRKDVEEGTRAYVRLNTLGMQLLKSGGFLLSASCSHHLPVDGLRDIVRRAMLKSGRQARIVAVGGQGMDHPVHPAMPETAYLKAMLAYMQ